jgi:hypothetical protein
MDNYSITLILQDSYFITPIPHDNPISQDFSLDLTMNPWSLLIFGSLLCVQIDGVTNNMQTAVSRKY